VHSAVIGRRVWFFASDPSGGGVAAIATRRRNGSRWTPRPSTVSKASRLRTHRGRIAVFSHGHLGRVLGVRWIGLALVEARHFLLGTASLGVLGQGSDRMDPPVIVQWNLLPAETTPVP